MTPQGFLAEVRRFCGKAVDCARQKGLLRVCSDILAHSCWNLCLYLTYQWVVRTRGSDNFVFRNREYSYFNHSYNTAWCNERSVEVPIVWDMVMANRDGEVLEVGNVLSHYFPVTHDVVDKYENAPNVISVDVVDFQPNKKYDLIVSISTLEHVGWDELPRDPAKIIRAIQHLKNMLLPGGKMVVTLPLGYNHEMDSQVGQGVLPFSEQRYLKRVSRSNRWAEVPWKAIRGAKYGRKFPGIRGSACGLVIGFAEGPE